MSKCALLGFSSFAVLLTCADGEAQQVEPQRSIDTITVTATKRETTLQDAPVAVSVVTQEEIEDAGIEDLIDLQSVVPALRVEQIQRSTETAFFIRGFGNGSGNIGLEPSVGVFIDGVYRSRSASQLADLPKLERVEVLRGPQSTLFGKNASAGIVSVVTSRPSFEQSGYVEAGLSNYDGRHLQGYYTGPISDRLALSVGGSLRKRDGYIDNVELGTDIGTRNRYALRGQMLFQPNNTMEFRLIADINEADEVCCGFLNAVNGPTGAAVEQLGGQVITDPYKYRTALSTDPENQIRNQGLSFHGQVDWDQMTLTSISAIRDHASSAEGDVDFTNIEILQPQLIDLDIQSISQEFRLTSDYDGPLNWMAGLFYYNEELSQTENLRYGTDAAAFIDSAFLGGAGLLNTLEALSGLPSGTFYEAGTGYFTRFEQNSKTLTIFGQVDFEINDRLGITAGISYLEDEKAVEISQRNDDVFSQINLFTVNNGTIPAAFFGQAFSDVTGLAPTPGNIAAVEAAAPGTTAAIEVGVSETLIGLGGLQFLPQFPELPNAVEDGRVNDDNVDYTVRITYDLFDNINLYASFATGYKASSFNLSTGSRPSSNDYAALYPNPVVGSVPARLGQGARFALPEEAEAFELGLKASGSSWDLNLALFDQTINNFQSVVFLGTTFGFSNAGEQSVTGIEYDLVFEPMEGLTLRTSGAYLDAVYDSFVGSPSGGDISGTRPGNVSEFYSTVSAKYEWVSAGHDAFVRVDYQHESDVDTEDGGDLNPNNLILDNGVTRRRGVDAFNASFGISRGDVSLLIWGRNLFNDEYPLQNAPAPLQSGSFNTYPSVPRSYGVDVRWTF